MIPEKKVEEVKTKVEEVKTKVEEDNKKVEEVKKIFKIMTCGKELRETLTNALKDILKEPNKSYEDLNIRNEYGF